MERPRVAPEQREAWRLVHTPLASGATDVTANSSQSTTGLRRFLDLQQQRDWMQGKARLQDADERAEFVELRLKYAQRYEKLMRKPQAAEVVKLLERYGRDCLPIPRRTERYYWSVSCMPSTPGKALIRVNASWMEFFALYADGDSDDVRAKFIVHLSDFTVDRSLDHDQVDEAFLQRCVRSPEDVGHFFPRGQDIFGIRVRGYASIAKFLSTKRVLQAIRAFNLTHMNRGRNAYQASHCYSVADYMQAD
jgi:hypothetical protein